MKLKFTVSVFILSLSFIAAQTKFKNGNELIKAMHNTYKGKWYKHFTFSQKMEHYRNDSIIKKEVWHEASTLPGNLIIKFDTKNSGNGIIFSNHKVYGLKDGKTTFSSPMVHDLLLVGLDVYFLKPEQTCKILDSIGYNLNKIREDVFEGRKVYVVGADKDDEQTPQFWIDAERLYMHRIIYKKKENVQDVVFGDYTKMNNYWVAKTIYFKMNGKLGLIEKYYDIKFPKTIDSKIYLPENFGNTSLN